MGEIGCYFGDGLFEERRLESAEVMGVEGFSVEHREVVVGSVDFGLLGLRFGLIF